MLPLVLIAGVLLVVALPFALSSPLITGVVVGGISVAVWLVRQGGYRFSLGLLLIFTLGATSTIAPLQSVATIGRPAALLLLIGIAFSQTRNTKATASRSTRAALGLLYLLAVLALVSAIWSVDTAGSLTQGAVFLGMVAVIHRSVTRRWTDRAVLVGDIKVAVAITALVLAAGLFAYYWGLIPATFSGRYQGLLNNPNMAAQISIIVTFLAWGLQRETRFKRYFVPIGIALVTILLSGSRAAILAVAVGVAFLLVRSGIRGLIVALVGGLVAMLALVSLGPDWLDPLLGRFGEVAAGDTLSGRSFIWDTAFTLIQQRPIGYGWGTTAVLFDDLINDGLTNTSAHSIHNSYLQTAVEGGILALVLTALIYIILFAQLAAFLFQRIPVQNPGGLISGLSGATIAGFVGQFSESGIYGVGQAYPYLYWIAVGGFLAMQSASARDDAREGAPTLRNRAVKAGS